MTLIRRHIIGLLAISGAAVAVPAYAAPPSWGAPYKAQSQGYVKYAQKSISPKKAKSIAARRVPGAKFVDISRSGDKYRVRMIRKNGRVIDVLIDASTGRVLN